MKGKLWYWGSYGTQDIKVGVVGFYKKTPDCRPAACRSTRARPTTELLRSCLETDLTTLNNYNVKLTYVPFTNNRLNFQNTWAEKVRNARDASDTRPIETTYRQKAVSSDFGTFGWLTGPVAVLEGRRPARHQRPLARRRDVGAPRQQLRARLPRRRRCADVQAAPRDHDRRLGPFVPGVDVPPPDQQPRRDVSSYFLPGEAGRRSLVQVRLPLAQAHSTSLNHHGGFIDARYTNGVANSADIWRDGNSESHLNTQRVLRRRTRSRKNRLTLNLGFRFDCQDDAALRGDVPANPFFPTLMPAIDFQGADAGVTWKDFSPRLGVTYDLNGRRQATCCRRRMRPTTARWRPASCRASSPPPARCSSATRGPTPTATRFVQANEVNTTRAVPQQEHGLRSGEPDQHHLADARRSRTSRTTARASSSSASTASSARRWPSAAATSGASTISSSGTIATTSRAPTTVPVTYQATTCPAGARCEAVTYYQPNDRRSRRRTSTPTSPDRYRDFNGFELTFQKRMSNRWSANASYAYNNAIDHWDSASAYEDPTNIDAAERRPVRAGIGRQRHRQRLHQRQVAVQGQRPRTRCRGTSTSPANYQARQGYPVPADHPVAEPRQRRGHGAGAARSARRRAPRQPPDDRLPRRQDVPLRRCHARPGDGHLQPDQRATRCRPSTATRRRPTPTRSAASRAARAALRRQRPLVTASGVSFDRPGGRIPAGPFFCTPRCWPCRGSGAARSRVVTRGRPRATKRWR